MSADENTSTSPFESEVALIIKDNANHVRNQLSRTRRVLDYDLKRKPTQFIRDTYYDTKEKLLQENKISLRIRRIDDTVMLSTKSDVRRIAGSIIQRREVERPWSYHSIRMLGRDLKLRTPTISATKFHRTPASTVLETMDLHLIQERRTKRQPRDVVIGGKTHPSILAELAIDHVTYAFEDIRVGLSEIEVEAKTSSLSSIREIADGLISKYQPSLQQWFHGKFVTGLAIRKLLNAKRLQTHVVNGELSTEAFELIDHTIRSRIF